MAKMVAGERFRKGLSCCTVCGTLTKYKCILCEKVVYLRAECSFAVNIADEPGWEVFKSVTYCFDCVNKRSNHVVKEKLLYLALSFQSLPINQ